MTTSDVKPPPDDTPKIGHLCELMVLNQHYDKDGNLIVNTTTAAAGESEDDSNYSNHALVHRRTFNKAHEIADAEVEINSPQILKAFETVVKYYPAYPMHFNEPITVKQPYMLLSHHWTELEEYRNNATDNVVRKHLNILLDFMERELRKDRKKYERLVDVGHISFALLWNIYKPGSLVISKPPEDPTQTRIYRLMKVEYDDDMCGRYIWLHMSCCEYDGDITGRYDASHYIRENVVGKATAITKLPFYPLEYADKPEEITQSLTLRGQRYLNFRGIHVQRYKGMLQLLKKPPLGFFSQDSSAYSGTFMPKSFEGRIVIDTKTFMEENPSFDNYLYDTEPTVDTFENHSGPKHTHMFWPAVDPLLCPPYVDGFSPSLKQWCRFTIDLISDPKWKENAFDRLILNPAPKRVIKSLVSAHEFPESAARDHQDSKGKGLVVLLHGTPGTGKTLTAEAVAEHTKRALLSISSGELGVTVPEIDNSLNRFLECAALWKAIVLIDEADVFLEARSNGVSNRLEQNSLVAVFLRHLEYFQGIVFLTSNRGSGLDPAIRSRIHLLLQFNPPDVNARRALWQQALQGISPSEADFDMEEALHTLTPLEMNGREISNALNLIKTLAREDKAKIHQEHFKTFLQVWNCFEVQEEGKGINGNGGKIRGL